MAHCSLNFKTHPSWGEGEFDTYCCTRVDQHEVEECAWLEAPYIQGSIIRAAPYPKGSWMPAKAPVGHAPPGSCGISYFAAQFPQQGHAFHPYTCDLEVGHEGGHLSTKGAHTAEFAEGTKQAMPPTKSKHDQFCYVCKGKMCEVCLACETEACLARDKHVTDNKTAIAYGYFSTRTQKAQGFLQLARFDKVPKPYILVQSESDIPAEDLWPSHEYFARPCPKVPWHGFVESRKVISRDEAIAVLHEAQAKDPDAEMIMCRPIEAEYNMVVTPAGVTVGPGHDGATAGVNTTTIPLGGYPFTGKMATDDFLKLSRVNTETEDPYYEVVVGPDGMGTYLTQVRAGAKAPASPDFVPETMQIEHVIEAVGDLIEFRDMATKFGPGTVVNHVGGSLISHYGVHCLINKIPILTTRVPVVGEVLEKTEDLPKPDQEAVLLGIAAGVAQPIADLYELRKRLNHMLLVLHNAPAQGGAAAYNIGYAATTMLHAGMAAAHGEARHQLPGGKNNSREMVHQLSWGDFFGSRKILGQAQWSFTHERWGSSYGGYKWACCTYSIIKLDEAMRTFMHNPTIDGVTAIINRLNIAINQAHNGGWWMNKFMQQHDFDRASKQDLEFVIEAAKYLPAVAQFRREHKTEIAEYVGLWKEQTEIEVVSRPNNPNLLRKDPCVITDADLGGGTEAPPSTDDDDEGTSMDDDGDMDPAEPADYVIDTSSDIAAAVWAGVAPKSVLPKPKPAVKKMPKFEALAPIVAAHVRKEGTAHYHIQIRDESGYQSYDYIAGPDSYILLDKKWHDHFGGLDPEVSYSSDATGYHSFCVAFDKLPYLLRCGEIEFTINKGVVYHAIAAMDEVPF